MSGERPRPRLRDVADAAGVSLGTASAAMNARADARIPAATQQRVRDTAARLGYRVNAHARAVRTGRTDLVLLSLRMLADPWCLALADAVNAASQRQGLATLIAADADWRELAERVAPDVVLVDSPDAADLPMLEQLVRQGRRVVVFTGDAELRPVGADVIVSDPMPGAALVVEHLTARTDDVVCLASSAQVRSREAGRRNRLDAYVDAVAAGAVRTERIVTYRESETDAFEAALALLAAERPAALYCTTDFAGLAAIRAAHSLGLQVPGELLVAGLGDTVAGARSVPSLTSAGPSDSYERIARIVVDAVRVPAADEPTVLPWLLHARTSTNGSTA